MVTQTQRSQATRRALIDAGRQLFAERGYTAVSVGELVELAGVTTGALYHQFASKEGLFKVVYAEVVQEVSARIIKARESSRDPSLVADCEIYLDACVNPAFHRIVLVDGPAVMGWNQVLDTAQFVVEGTLAAARERDELADPPTESLARLLAAAMKEAGVIIATAADPASARANTSEGVRRLIAGLMAS
jgi:AcrR family transcriptional regulator